MAACRTQEKSELNQEILSNMGKKIKADYVMSADEFAAQISRDSTNTEALMGLAETNIILYILWQFHTFLFSSHKLYGHPIPLYDHPMQTCCYYIYSHVH